jgi:hypothetical protein
MPEIYYFERKYFKKATSFTKQSFFRKCKSVSQPRNIRHVKEIEGPTLYEPITITDLKPGTVNFLAPYSFQNRVILPHF